MAKNSIEQLLKDLENFQKEKNNELIEQEKNINDINIDRQQDFKDFKDFNEILKKTLKQITKSVLKGSDPVELQQDLKNETTNLIENIKNNILINPADGAIVENITFELNQLDELMTRVSNYRKKVKFDFNINDIKAALFKPIITLTPDNPKFLKGNNHYSLLYSRPAKSLDDLIKEGVELTAAQIDSAYQSVKNRIATIREFVFSYLTNPDDHVKAIEALKQEIPTAFGAPSDPK